MAKKVVKKAAPKAAAPVAAPAPRPVVPAPGVTAPRIKAWHVVAAGDTPTTITQKYYGSTDPAQWTAIYEINKTASGLEWTPEELGQIFGRLKDEDSTLVISRHLDDPDPRVRANAVEALGQLGKPGDVIDFIGP